MNNQIEPGCTAIITYPSCYGWPVHVIDRAPFGDFELPDGTQAQTSGPGRWIFESLAGDLRAIDQPSQHRVRSAKYGTCIEQRLLRIDGNEDQFRTEQDERIADRMLEGVL